MIKHEKWVCMKLRPWKCREMVFIIGEKVEIWLNISRGTQGKGVMTRISHKMIKGQD
jgi:hypothetical protein